MWHYQGKELDPATIPESAMGFIYMITQVSTGKKYIGRKLLTRTCTKTVKGVKKRIRKESDWKDYWSSSPKIKEWIEANGTSDFTREILAFCKSKGSLAYMEEMALYQCGALESDSWINDNIRSKIYRSWISKDLEAAKELREKLNSV